MRKATLKNEEKILKVLTEFTYGLVRGAYTDIYLPPAYPLKGFSGLEVIFSTNPQQVFLNIKMLIQEMMRLEHPKYVHEPTVNKCIGAIKGILGDAEALYFVNKYLSINREFFKEILNILDYQGVINGAIGAIQISILRSKKSVDYERAYTVCGHVKVGESEEDIALKRIYAIARFYDNLLIIIGAASHEPSSLKELKFGKGRSMPYTLYATPFTKALYYVLSVGEGLDDYIEVYKGFVKRIVMGYINKKDPVEVSILCSEYLKQYEYIGVNTDERFVRNSMMALWRLLNEIR